MTLVAVSPTAHTAVPIATAGPFGAVSAPTVVGALAVVLLVFGGLAVYQRTRARRSGIAGVDRMDVKTLEETLTSLFRQLGYVVEGTRCHGDFAAELVVAKDGERTVVEGKRWGKTIGVNAIQAAIAARGDFDCDHALVIANRQFTGRAKKLAKTNKVELWDREALIGKLLKLDGVPAASGAAPVLGAPDPGTTPAPAPPVAATSGMDADLEPVRIGSAPAQAVVQMAATSAPPIAPPGSQLLADDVDPATGFAACGLCGITVSGDDRTRCLTQRARFGGRVYCRAHQSLFGGGSD
jgi:restriction system protein